MLKFEKIDIHHRTEFKERLQDQNYNNSEFSFGNIFIWRDGYKIQVCTHNDIMYIKGTTFDNNCDLYFQPIVPQSLRVSDALDCIKAHQARFECKFKLSTVNQEFMQRILKEEYHCLKIYEDVDMFDYVYETQNLALLPGKKYRKKRGHVNKYNKSHEYRYELLNSSHYDDCIQIYRLWLGDREDICNEHSAVHHALIYFDELEFSGIIIYIDDKPAAFTVGEKYNHNSAIIHLEKAIPEQRELYPVINQIYVKEVWMDKCEYINREEDMGIEGLRKAKQSYYPYELVKKYDIELNEK